ncbi:MAG: hypothetical protein ACFB21_09985 [Opitutales bacterium]
MAKRLRLLALLALPVLALLASRADDDLQSWHIANFALYWQDPLT